jgi:DNA polymerase-3 subunit delta
MLPYAAFNKKKVLLGDEPRRIYGLVGDAFLQKKVLNALIGWSLSPDARDFNMDVLDGESTSLNDLLARCGNLPFLSDNRVVVLQRAERLENLHRGAGGGSDTADGDDDEDAPSTPSGKSAAGKGAAGKGAKTSGIAKRLGDGLKKLPATTILILQHTPETPEPGARASTPRCLNASLDKVIEGKELNGLIVDCTINTKDARTPIAIVQNEAEERNIPLAPDAAAHLVNRCGHDLALLLNELEKCAMRAGAGNVVTRAIIDDMTRRQSTETIFNLTDALGERKIAHALGLMRELMENGDAPPQIVAMLARHWRQLLQARAFMDAKLPLDGSTLSRLPLDLAAQLPKDNLANYLQAQAWQGKRLASQARNFSTPQLGAILEATLAADLAMKGIEGDGGADSKKEPELLLELFVAQLG